MLLAGDIATVDHRQALGSLIRERYGRLDVLVNNAGLCDDGPLEEQNYQELAEVVEVNLVAVLDLCRVMAPLLFTSDHASVINISSIYGLVASRGPMAAYTRRREPSSTSPATLPCSGAHAEFGSTRSRRATSPPR